MVRLSLKSALQAQKCGCLDSAEQQSAYYIERIKQLFLNDFRSAPPPFTPTPNGFHRHVFTIPFSGSDYLILAQSIWCGSTPEISKAVA
jgi:hypothetical protein